MATILRAVSAASAANPIGKDRLYRPLIFPPGLSSGDRYQRQELAMLFFRNILVYGLNSAILLSSKQTLSTKDIPDLLDYCLIWIKFVIQQLSFEVDKFIPTLEKSLGKEYYEKARKTNKSLQKSLSDFKGWSEKIRKSPKDFSPLSLRDQTDAFAPLLIKHFTFMVRSVSPEHLKDKVDEKTLAKLEDQLLSTVRKNNPYDQPFIITNLDLESHREASTFLNIGFPGPALWGTRKMLYGKKKQLWNYSSCDKFGVLKEIMADALFEEDSASSISSVSSVSSAERG